MSDKKWHEGIPMKDKLDIAWRVLNVLWSEEDLKEFQELVKPLSKGMIKK